jgi:hypothetical protein
MLGSRHHSNTRLKHGADGLPGRTKFVNNPDRQGVPVCPLHTAKTEVLQNLGAMPPGRSNAEIIAGQLIGPNAEPFCQIFGCIIWNCSVVISEKAARAEKLQLRGQAQPRCCRLGIDEINVAEAQAPLADKIRTRSTPYSSLRSSNWSAMSRAGTCQVNPADQVPTTFFELAKIVGSTDWASYERLPEAGSPSRSTQGRRMIGLSQVGIPMWTT